MNTAFIFPGQGAQTIGMGKDFADQFLVAKDIFEKADNILGYKLTDICFEGPEDKLNSTIFSQPAIFVTSAAILEVLRSNEKTSRITPDVTAGLSLGEYSALYAAGAMSFEDGLRLVQKRGEAMQAAADSSKGGMVSILKLEGEKLDELIKEAAQDQILVASNFNCPGQVVLTGQIEACERAVELAEKFGAMKAIPLKVAGAFHSEMMSPAANSLKEALINSDIRTPNTKVIANIDAEYYSDAQSIISGLTTQLVQPILWQKSMEKLLAQGCDTFYEIGPNRVLTGLMKKINRKTKVINISTVAAFELLLS